MTSPATIVIVDDQLVIVELLAEFLLDEGYQVFATSDPEEGLAYILKTPPDLVILDLMMPVLTGWDIFDRVRGREETQHLPIILVTAAPRQASIEYQQRDTISTALMPKPLGLDELLVTIERLLQTPPPPPATSMPSSATSNKQPTGDGFTPGQPSPATNQPFHSESPPAAAPSPEARHQTHPQHLSDGIKLVCQSTPTNFSSGFPQAFGIACP
jgi:DNA-binding response OmpR family regulator